MAPSAAEKEEIPLETKGYDYAREATLGTISNDVPNVKDDQHTVSDGASTATDSSDEFDWEADDDSIAATEHHHKAKARRGRALWNLFLRLARPLRITLIGVIGAGTLIAPLLVFRLRFPHSPALPHVFAWSLWASIIWVAACLTGIVVDLVPRLIILIVDGLDGNVEHVKMEIELVLAVKAWIKLALDISWAWIALSVIRTIYQPPGTYWVIVNRAMQALFSAGMLLLVEKLFLRFVAINFHRKALSERIAENRHGLKALDRLTQITPAHHRKPPYVGRKGHKSQNSSFGALNMFRQSQVLDGGASPSSATNSPIREKERASPEGRRKTRRAKHAEGKQRRSRALNIIVDSIGQVALKDSKFNQGVDYGGLYSARKLARKLFLQLSDVVPHRDYLLVEDFEPYFETTAEAHAAFVIFDKDGNGDISKKEMREAVQRIYRERKALISSLKDVGSAVAKLDAVLIGVVVLVLLFLCLLIFNKHNTVTSLVPLASFVVGFSFIFGNSAAQLFQSLVFIFSTHVFDVGDLVMIDDSPLFVKEFGLFSTVFKRVDGVEVIAPNSLLQTSKIIHNMRRSGSMWESTNLMISYDTPLEQVDLLRQKMQEYVQQNNREWSNVTVNIDHMDQQNVIFLIISMEHRSSFHDWGGRWGRRTAFMRNLKTVLEELDMRYSLPVQPVMLPPYSPWRNDNRPSLGQQNTFLQTPPQGRYGPGRDDLGNAGFFTSDPMNRAPGISISNEPNTFRDARPRGM